MHIVAHNTHTHTQSTIDVYAVCMHTTRRRDRLAYPHVGKQCLQLSLGDKIGSISSYQLKIREEREGRIEGGERERGNSVRGRGKDGGREGREGGESVEEREKRRWIRSTHTHTH